MEYTSKGLRKPQDGEPARVEDLNFNSDLLNNQAMGAFVCTSTTRPTGGNRWVGQIIFEEDTNATYLYDGTGWRSIPLLVSSVDVDGLNGFTSSVRLNKYSDGMIDIVGNLQGTPTAGSPTGSGFTMLSLPSGYRPSNSFKVWVGCSTPSSSNQRYIGFEAGTSTVTCIWSGGISGSTWAQGTAGSGAFMSGIRYRAQG